ncbi:MAG: efflux RND transporter periplasmic adaptor subunit [bacterium]
MLVRRWPLFAGGAGILIVLLLLLARRTGVPAPAANASHTPGDPAKSATAGDTSVTLDSAALRLAGVKVIAASASVTDELVANGTIVYNADRLAVVAPRAEGRIAKVLTDLGQEVGAGQVLAIVESPDVGTTRGDLERARAAVSVSKRNYEREKRLFEQEISPQKEMLDAEVIYRTAEADFSSAQSKLRTYGATSGSGGSYGLRSAVAGTVVERNASPGLIVGPISNVFTVADLRHVWIAVDVYEADLKRVHRGAAVTVAPTALPGETFAGRVTFAGGVVDSTSRTIKLRVTVENESRRLRPGMFAQVRIAAPSGVDGTSASAVTVPEVAVQDLNGQPVLFVQTAPGRFVARHVTIGTAGAGGTVLVRQGVRAGELIVVQGAFQLKSELLKSTFGED